MRCVLCNDPFESKPKVKFELCNECFSMTRRGQRVLGNAMDLAPFCRHMCCISSNQAKHKDHPAKQDATDSFMCSTGVTRRLKDLRRRHAHDLHQDPSKLLNEADLCSKLNQDGLTWCHYCGIYGSVGLDRVDNLQGYSVVNVVPCCVLCNFIKADLHVDVFLDKACKICRHFEKTSHQVKDNN